MDAEQTKRLAALERAIRRLSRRVGELERASKKKPQLASPRFL